MSHEEEKHIDFAPPAAIKDFIFDLHDACRRCMRVEDVQPLYEQKFKEFSDKYFVQSAWPTANAIASECNNDEIFLTFYKEITIRHLFVKLKQLPVEIYLESWANYNTLFNLLISSNEPIIVLTPQWACDIVQEFLYQFQEFCQFRTQAHARSEAEIETLSANPHVWSIAGVAKILRKLVSIYTSKQFDTNSANSLVGYFSIVEMARMFCLMADYDKSLETIFKNICLWEPTELFRQVSSCHVNVFLHAGVSLMMVRRYSDAIDVFSELVLHLSKVLKPGQASQRANVVSQQQKVLDKVLSLTLICISLNPGHRVDDLVLECINNKHGEKLKKIQGGDMTALQDVFESASPKFIFVGVPDYSQQISYCHEAFNTQVTRFLTEARQQFAVLRLRSYLRLYSTIPLDKLSKFNEVSQEELLAKLLAFGHKSAQVVGGHGLDESSLAQITSNRLTPSSVSDLHFRIRNNDLLIDNCSAQGSSSKAESFFISGIRKNVDASHDINRIFTDFGL